MESIDKFYCPLPFKHLFVAPNGIKPCCSFSGTYEGTIEEHLSSALLKSIQKSILNGIVPTGCKACYDGESTTNHSTRLIALDDYNNERYEQTDIDYIDLRSSNLCNLKCRTCNPLFSSRIQSELNKNHDALSEYYSYDASSTLIHTTNSNFEYIKNHLSNINRLNLTGGEPTFMPEVKDMLQVCFDQQFTGNILMTSNLNFTDDFWFDLTKRLGEQIHWTISIDAIGKNAEIIRSGSSWTLMDQNIHKLTQLSNSIEYNITISSLNAMHINELLLYINDIKNNYQHIPNGQTIRLSPCWEPDYLQVRNIPLELKNKIITELEQTLTSQMLHNDIANSINEIIAVLSQFNADVNLWDKCVTYNTILNGIRKEDFTID